MNKIEFLSTTELERLEKELRDPTTLSGSIMYRGVMAELQSRPGYTAPKTEREEELEEEGDGLRAEINDLESKAESIRDSKEERICELEAAIREAKHELDAAQENPGSSVAERINNALAHLENAV